MFDDLDVLAARLLAAAPVEDPDGRPQCWPELDRDGSLVDELVALERVKAAADARSMLIMATMADWADTWQTRHDPRFDLQKGPAELAAAEIAPALHLAPVTAAIRVDRAVAITTRLPGTHAAFSRGDLDLGRVLAIEEATSVLDPALAARVEAKVLPRAVDQTAGELRRALRRAVLAADPGAAEQRRQDAVRGRSVRRYARADGTSALEAVLSAIDTGEIYDLVDEVARRTKTTDDTRTVDARRADALVLLLLGRDPHLGPDDDGPPPTDPPPDDHDTPPDPAGDEPHDERPTDPDDEHEPPADGQPAAGGAVDGVVDQARAGQHRDDPGPVEPPDLDERFAAIPDRISELAALALSAMTTRRAPTLPWVAINSTTGPDGAVVAVGELQGYGPITAEHAQALLATGAARPPDPPSGRQPTAAQARTHDPPDWLALEIRSRDGTCRFPGCCQPAHRVDLDHTVAHPAGLTVAPNLGGLCRRHHRVKHSGCWTVCQHSDGIFEWTSTITGRTYTTYPRGTTGDWHGATTGRT